jgi:hypothetical protein
LFLSMSMSLGGGGKSLYFKYYCPFCVCVWYWGLNSGPSPWATPPALFLWRVFRDRVSQTICLGWLWTMILLISASWVARIIGIEPLVPSYCCPFEPHKSLGYRWYSFQSHLPAGELFWTLGRKSSCLVFWVRVRETPSSARPPGWSPKADLSWQVPTPSPAPEGQGLDFTSNSRGGALRYQ